MARLCTGLPRMPGRIGAAIAGFIGRRIWVMEYTIVDWRERMAKSWRALKGL